MADLQMSLRCHNDLQHLILAEKKEIRSLLPRGMKYTQLRNNKRRIE